MSPISKELYFDRSRFYRQYKEQLERNFLSNALYDKFCYMNPGLAKEYIQMLEMPNSKVRKGQEELVNLITKDRFFEKEFPESEYIVCALGVGGGYIEQYFVKKMQASGKKVHFVVNDTSLSLTRYALENTDAVYGFCLDFIRDLPQLKNDIFSALGKRLPIVFLMLGYTFSSISLTRFLPALQNTLTKQDLFLFDTLLIDQVSHFESQLNNLDHTYINPIISQDHLLKIAYFYGFPQDQNIQFHTLYEEDSLLYGGFRKNYMVNIKSNTSITFRETSHRFMKGELFSLFQLRSFTEKSLREVMGKCTIKITKEATLERKNEPHRILSLSKLL